MSVASTLFSLFLYFSLSLYFSFSFSLSLLSVRNLIMPSSKTMAKGTKRKIEIKKRDTKQQRAVACSKRRQTVFSKAADLCLLSGANIAVFVTSPSENSDVVYSFSGYSPASEIADCYLNGKLPPTVINPQPKLGFWWEDPDLYRSCDDLSELNMIEDRIKKTKKDLMACLEKKQNSQFVSNFDQNPRDCSLDVSCSQFVSFDQNLSFENCGGSSSQFVSDFDQNPTAASLHGWPNSPQMVSFDQNANSSLYGEPCSQVATFDPNPSFSVQEIYGESSSDQTRYLLDGDLGFVNCLWEAEKENNGISLPQETQTQEAMVNLGEDDYDKEDVLFGLNNDFCLYDNNPQVNTINEEEGDYMIDIEELFSEEEMGLLGFCEFID